jgi:hypothetical protein
LTYISVSAVCREWEEMLDADSGSYYYHNVITKETSWDRPLDFVKTMGNWEERANEEGKLFYVNRVRGRV